MKLIVLDAAQTELEEARDYYLEHATPSIAAAFVAEYEHGALRLLQYPHVGALVAPRQRTLALRHFPYSIIYRVTADLITIHAIAHQRRRPGYWDGRR